MADKYDRLKKLAELHASGVLSDAEYLQEKQKILDENSSSVPPPIIGRHSNHNNIGGMDEKTYILLMHLSQLLGGFVIPLIMWLIKREQSKKIDEHGVKIMNFIITFTIAVIASFILFPLWVATGLFFMPVLINLGLFAFALVAIIKAAVDHNNDKPVHYPLSIKMIKPYHPQNIV